MKKIFKLFTLLVLTLCSVLVLASCGYKGKAFVYDKLEVSKPLQQLIDSTPFMNLEAFSEDYSSAFGRIEFSKDGKTVTSVLQNGDEVFNNESNVIVEGKFIYIDDNKDGVLDEEERLSKMEVKGSKIVITVDVSSSLGKTSGYWVKIYLKKA
ncbi:MAG: hypothetical protein LBV51_05210 [Acholeplasmatales bacterium]|jgi:predicted small lipoprotein YifL|nr:hypothetical protein [Acholeplasmatales bacterium]